MKNVTPHEQVIEIQNLFHTFYKLHEHGFVFLFFILEKRYFSYSQGNFCSHMMKIIGMKLAR